MSNYTFIRIRRVKTARLSRESFDICLLHLLPTRHAPVRSCTRNCTSLKRSVTPSDE